jgi:nucleoside-diphosphate-sugar epimerase
VYQGVYALGKHLQEEAARRLGGELGITVAILRPWVVVDAETRRLRDGTSLDAEPDPLGHNGAWGWVERRDLAEACALALTAPIEEVAIVHLLPNPLGRALADPTEADRLGWRPRYDFADAVPPGTRLPEPPATVITAR